MKKVNTQNNNNNASSITIEQFTTVYHVEHGKGHVVSVTYRKDNNLIMCYFPKDRVHDWIGEVKLRSGVGDITLTRNAPSMQDEQIPDSLQSVLENLFAPR